MKTPEQTGAEIKSNAIQFGGLDGEGVCRVYPFAPFERLCTRFANFALMRVLPTDEGTGMTLVRNAAFKYGQLLLKEERNYWKIESHIRLTFHPHIVAMNESCEEFAKSIKDRAEKFHTTVLLRRIAESLEIALP